MKFRERPIVIDAIQWTGENLGEVLDFTNNGNRRLKMGKRNALIVFTLEGQMVASPMDWIIIGVSGEAYPCKPDIFEKTYKKVE